MYHVKMFDLHLANIFPHLQFSGRQGLMVLFAHLLKDEGVKNSVFGGLYF